MPGIDSRDDTASQELLRVLKKYWGYESFRPLQREAMCSVLDNRDSIVVLPTGGGKSLCFQAPAICTPGLAVVVSPLISLMKDQVDALTSCGVPAACINSSMSAAERRHVADEIEAGRLKLLYVAPERLLQPRTIEFLKTANVSLVAIDEAHCISEWGHDFRPEYRELRILKRALPNIGIHAYTATATERVRDDIVRELTLEDPEILVGSFDRPNLSYKVRRRNQFIEQACEIMDRYPGDSGIIYCISRADVDRTCLKLTQRGYRALPYHAGLSDDERRRNQEAFITEKVDTIVATVAFGMGIDKSNVRYVIHAGMPKSLENYQQESGRAGRDGLEAECCLFYSGADFGRWKRMIEESDPNAQSGAMHSLLAIFDFCSGVVCRHRVLVGYFGQELEAESCKACDVCLGELDLVADALIVGQKILSSVVRQEQRFGGDYTSLVLKGSKDQRIVQNGHDKLSTWGLLADEDQRGIRDWIEQLVSQGFLVKVGEYNVLHVTEDGRRLLRGEVTPRLLKPTKTEKTRERRAKSKSAVASWDGVDRGLFEMLRELRREKANERGVPAYIIFGDASLRDMARRRPSSLNSFSLVRGVGDKKREDFGQEFVERISNYCRQQQLKMDVSS